MKEQVETLDQALNILRDISKKSADSERAMKRILIDGNAEITTQSEQIQKWYDDNLEDIKDIEGFDEGDPLSTFLAQKKIEPVNANGIFTLAQCGFHRKLISNIAHGLPVIDNDGYANEDQNNPCEKIQFSDYKNTNTLFSVLQTNERKSPDKFYYIGVNDSMLGHDYSIIQKGKNILLLQSYVGKYSLDGRLNGTETLNKEMCHSLDDFIEFLDDPFPTDELQTKYYGAISKINKTEMRFKIPAEGCHEFDINNFLVILKTQQMKFNEREKKVDNIISNALPSNDFEAELEHRASL